MPPPSPSAKPDETSTQPRNTVHRISRARASRASRRHPRTEPPPSPSKRSPSHPSVLRTAGGRDNSAISRGWANASVADAAGASGGGRGGGRRPPPLHPPGIRGGRDGSRASLSPRPGARPVQVGEVPCWVLGSQALLTPHPTADVHVENPSRWIQTSSDWTRQGVVRQKSPTWQVGQLTNLLCDRGLVIAEWVRRHSALRVGRGKAEAPDHQGEGQGRVGGGERAAPAAHLGPGGRVIAVGAAVGRPGGRKAAACLVNVPPMRRAARWPPCGRCPAGRYRTATAAGRPLKRGEGWREHRAARTSSLAREAGGGRLTHAQTRRLQSIAEESSGGTRRF